MKKTYYLYISISLVLAMLVFLSACSQPSPSATSISDSSTPATLNGQELLQQRCTTCHTTSRITQSSGTGEKWTDVVDSMISKGAQLSRTERQVLIDHLVQTYP